MITLDAGTTETPPPQFEEAVRWFRGRVPMTQAVYDALAAEAQRRAFTLAGAAALTVVSEVWRSLDATLAEGRTLRDFKRDVAPGLLAQWGGSVATPAWRMEVIFRNATQRAYTHGRVEQLRDPAVARTRPFWMFDAVGDARTSAICTALDGTVLRASDPWWATHTPPCHHACRSTIRGLRANDPRVAAAGPAPDTEAQAGFGVLPEADDWTPRAGDYPADVWAAYQSNPQAYRAPKPRTPTMEMPVFAPPTPTPPSAPVAVVDGREDTERWVAGQKKPQAVLFHASGRVSDLHVTEDGSIQHPGFGKRSGDGGVLVIGRASGAAPTADDIAAARRLNLSELRYARIENGRVVSLRIPRPSFGWPEISQEDIDRRLEQDVHRERLKGKALQQYRARREGEIVLWQSGAAEARADLGAATDAKKARRTPATSVPPHVRAAIDSTPRAGRKALESSYAALVGDDAETADAILRHPDPRGGSAWVGERIRLAAELGDRMVVIDDHMTSDHASPAQRTHEHLEELARFPSGSLRRLRDISDVTFYIGNRASPDMDDLSYLRGVRPRGWEEGKTWDDAPGLFSSSTNSVIAAGGGSHASASLIAHETGHAFGKLLRRAGSANLDNDPETEEAHRRLFRVLTPYEKQGGPGGFAGRQEFVAESIAVLVTRGRLAAIKQYDALWVEFLEREVLRSSA